MAWKMGIASLLTVMVAMIAGLYSFDWINRGGMKCVLSERSSINVLNSKESYSGGLNHSFISNRTTDDIRYHMGGNGPFIPKVRNIAERGIDPPEGCYVDQVHMVDLEWPKFLISCPYIYDRLQDTPNAIQPSTPATVSFPLEPQERLKPETDVRKKCLLW